MTAEPAKHWQAGRINLAKAKTTTYLGGFTGDLTQKGVPGVWPVDFEGTEAQRDEFCAQQKQDTLTCVARHMKNNPDTVVTWTPKGLTGTLGQHLDAGQLVALCIDIEHPSGHVTVVAARVSAIKALELAGTVTVGSLGALHQLSAVFEGTPAPDTMAGDGIVSMPVLWLFPMCYQSIPCPHHPGLFRSSSKRDKPGVKRKCQRLDFRCWDAYINSGLSELGIKAKPIYHHQELFPTLGELQVGDDSDLWSEFVDAHCEPPDPDSAEDSNVSGSIESLILKRGGYKRLPETQADASRPRHRRPHAVGLKRPWRIEERDLCAAVGLFKHQRPVEVAIDLLRKMKVITNDQAASMKAMFSLSAAKLTQLCNAINLWAQSSGSTMVWNEKILEEWAKEVASTLRADIVRNGKVPDVAPFGFEPILRQIEAAEDAGVLSRVDMVMLQYHVRQLYQNRFGKSAKPPAHLYCGPYFIDIVSRLYTDEKFKADGNERLWDERHFPTLLHAALAGSSAEGWHVDLVRVANHNELLIKYQEVVLEAGQATVQPNKERLECLFDEYLAKA
ncbi:hypothetical protein WJX73_003345 [Symbiochloris irregularis]|uniref:Uncharacterized protein n=1 Tax=Symbiochloris irregularis TaxID=706552 RepID=A0AAW1P365_9CHLO